MASSDGKSLTEVPGNINILSARFKHIECEPSLLPTRIVMIILPEHSCEIDVQLRVCKIYPCPQKISVSEPNQRRLAVAGQSCTCSDALPRTL